MQKLTDEKAKTITEDEVLLLVEKNILEATEVIETLAANNRYAGNAKMMRHRLVRIANEQVAARLLPISPPEESEGGGVE